MRIGIVTHSNCLENYGQQLQGFALQHVLQKFGYKPFFIRYVPSSGLLKTTVRRFKKALLTPQEVYVRIKNISADNRKDLIKNRRFDEFKKSYCVSTSKTYQSRAQLLEASEIRAEAYVCGSDQIWNEKCVTHDDNGRPWFLDFGSDNARRIAYAPSFGADSISACYQQFITPMLQRLDYVSVRESMGVEICRKVGRNDAVHVVDPTLLLNGRDFFTALDIREDKKLKAKPYALFYLLKTKSDVLPLKEMVALCDEQHLGKIAVSVYGDFKELSGYYVQPTVQGWLQLLSKADVVFTNSFHGTAFSILFKRPFVVFPRKGDALGMNTRIESLLADLCITNRICHNIETLTDILQAKIPWRDVNNRLDERREFSMCFLKNALLGKPFLV